MTVPSDLMAQRAQEAFAILQSMAAPAAVLQILLIATFEDWRGPAVQPRMVINISILVMALTSLIALTRRGRVVASARFVGVCMLLLDLYYARSFGISGAPTSYAYTLAVVSLLSMVESRRTIALWVLLFGLVIGYGMLSTPLHTFQPNPYSMTFGVLVTLAFSVLFLSEFRSAMVGLITTRQGQADELSAKNRELVAAIDERDRLSTELATAKRLEAMGRMAGSIAHDFNNLLTVIRGYADLIASDTPAEAPHRRELTLLTRAVDRASRVTRDVLDFASPRPFAMQRTDLARFIRELVPNLTQLLSPRVLLDVVTPAEDNCAVLLDRAQMERVILNLATNARDVSPPGGTIRITVSRRGDHVDCAIEDHGPGVPPDLREQIFEPFFTTKGTTGGTGLGLASVYSIARQHGGAITVGDTPGGGATFVLSLPIDVPRTVAEGGSFALATTSDEYAASGAAIAQTTAQHRAAPLAGLTVLLVEDDEALRRLAVRLLHRAGATVHAIDNGVDALLHLQRAVTQHEAIHLVVTDLRLPRGSGAEVIDLARSMSPPLAVVAISGFLEDPAVAQRAARQELSFLPKPFSEQHLLAAIDTARRYNAA
ncbi:MAG: response regulator [Gemmatimonadaceae bacterium]|nr:response regulator [Gemmatimonadaceae bacterium]